MLLDRVRCARAGFLPIRLLAIVLAAASLAGIVHAEPNAPVDAATPMAASKKTARGGDRAVRVESLAIEGNDALSDSEVVDYMLTRRPSWRPWAEAPRFDERVLAEDLLRIVSLYRLRGYYEAKATSEVIFGEKGLRVAITVRVSEGPDVRVAAFDVPLPPGLGVDAETWQKWLEALSLQQGDVFRLDHYANAKAELLTRLANQAFPAARLEGGADVDLATHEARIDWQIVLGDEIVFGEISLAGLADVEAEVVRRELAFAPGDPYSARAIAKTRSNLQGLQLFRWVSIDAAPPAAPKRETGDVPLTSEPTLAEGVWPVRIEVAERSPRGIELAGGYGTEDRFRARVTWEHRNFFGDARRLELDVRYSSLLSAAEARLRQPHFPDPKTTMSLKTSLRYETPPAYKATRVLGSIDFDRPLAMHLRGRAGYELSFNDVEAESADAGLVINEPVGQGLINTLRFGLTRSTVRSLLDARDGSWIDFTLEPAVSTLGSTAVYMLYDLDMRLYRPIGRVVVAGRFEIATIQPFGSSEAGDVPLTERLYAGGSNSVRGYGFQKLGPKDDNGNPVGGTSRMVGSVELRVPLWRKIGGVAFVDMGQVYLEPFTWDLDDLRFSSGVGLRYDTPVGPVRLDAGFRLNPERALGKYAIHFSIGHAF